VRKLRIGFTRNALSLLLGPLPGYLETRTIAIEIRAPS